MEMQTETSYSNSFLYEEKFTEDYNYLIYGGKVVFENDVEPLLKRVEDSPEDVRKIGSAIKEGVKKFLGFYKRAFVLDDYNPKDKITPDCLFNRIFFINKKIEGINSNGGEMLPYIEIAEEYREYEKVVKDADLRHFIKNESQYWP
ncbi:MAG: hypothetical protein QXN71_01645 [Candidatus Aenigmatarchaeota archaeon]